MPSRRWRDSRRQGIGDEQANEQASRPFARARAASARAAARGAATRAMARSRGGGSPLAAAPVGRGEKAHARVAALGPRGRARARVREGRKIRQRDGGAVRSIPGGPRHHERRDGLRREGERRAPARRRRGRSQGAASREAEDEDGMAGHQSGCGQPVASICANGCSRATPCARSHARPCKASALPDEAVVARPGESGEEEAGGAVSSRQ